LDAEIPDANDCPCTLHGFLCELQCKEAVREGAPRIPFRYRCVCPRKRDGVSRHIYLVLKALRSRHALRPCNRATTIEIVPMKVAGDPSRPATTSINRGRTLPAHEGARIVEHDVGGGIRKHDGAGEVASLE